MLNHLQWRAVVLASYPKYFVSPERDITGLGAMIDARKDEFKPIYRAVKGNEYARRKANNGRVQKGKASQRI